MSYTEPPEPPGAVPASESRTERLPPFAPPPSPRRLTRSRDDRMIAGVAGGLGRYFGIDPVIVRIAFAVGALAGGAGVLAYLAAWLVVPEDGAATRPLSSRPAAIVGAAFLGLVAFVVLGPALTILAPGAFLLGVIALLLVLVARGAGEHPSASDVVRRAAVLLGVLLLAFAGAIAVGVAAAVGGDTVLAGVVVAIGVLLVGAGLAGRGRWLVIPALVVAVPLALVAAADIEADGSVGDRDYRPGSIAEVRDRYELGMGELMVDLRDVTFPQGTTSVALELGVGRGVVLVPEGVCIETVAEVGAGEAQVLDRESSGLGVDVAWSQADADGLRPRILIDAHVGAGRLEVQRDEWFYDELDDDHWAPGRFDEHEDPVAVRPEDVCGVAA